MPTRRPRVLLFSTLFPSVARPGHGLFVETRLRELVATGRVEARVIAPVPWFFSTDQRWGAYAQMAATPRRAVRDGIAIVHPRYPVLPKIGMSIAPLLLALWSLPAALRLRRQGFDFDLIDAHYAYPDGAAAALLSRWLNRPLAITARGSDLHQIADFAGPRAWLRWAQRQARACIGVSAGLAQRWRALGAAEDKVAVWRNGVDLQRFVPMEMAEARARLGLPQGVPLLVQVGNLLPVKRPQLALETLAWLRRQPEGREARLVWVGHGPEREALQARAAALGLEAVVHFAGAVPQSDLSAWFSAAQLSLLCSEREGWPNVVLESLACGTPVVGVGVGAVPDIVTSPVAGRVVEIHPGATLTAMGAVELPAALGAAALDVLRQPFPRAAVRAVAEPFGWGPTSAAQALTFERWLSSASAAGEERHA